jgi:hypothetical protein
MRLRTLIGMAAGLVAVVAIGAVLASASGTVLFSDYFTNQAGPNWTFYNRYGTIANGRLQIDGPYRPDAVDRDGWALSHVGDRTWTNYSFDVFYDTENVRGDPAVADRHMTTLYFRVAAQNPASRPTTMYRLDIWDPGNPSEGWPCPPYGVPVPAGYIEFSKIVNGAGSHLTDVCVSNTTNGTNAARVIVYGNTTQVLVNGQAVLRYTDPTPIRYGGVGVGQIRETNGWYDNVVVQALN